jgi:hypothetical protein
LFLWIPQVFDPKNPALGHFRKYNEKKYIYIYYSAARKFKERLEPKNKK